MNGAFCVISRNLALNSGSQRFSPMFSSKGFMALHSDLSVILFDFYKIVLEQLEIYMPKKINLDTYQYLSQKLTQNGS